MRRARRGAHAMDTVAESARRWWRLRALGAGKRCAARGGGGRGAWRRRGLETHHDGSGARLCQHCTRRRKGEAERMGNSEEETVSDSQRERASASMREGLHT